MSGANFSGALGAERAMAQMQFIPESGSFEAWKICKDKVLIKLLIPEDAERSHGSERKCRASKAIVIDVIGANEGRSLYDAGFIYRKGETVTPDRWDKDRWNTCGAGIHFFLTRMEAENYNE